MAARVSAVRVLSVATMLLVLILIGGYALGLNHSPNNQRQARTATIGSQTEPPDDVVSDDPPTHDAEPESPSPTPSPQESRTPSPNPDTAAFGLPLPLEEEGPFGSRMTTGTRKVALTFDDGPDPQYTPEALDLLRYYGVKATFCLVGQNAQAHPELVRAIVADGHTLCNHSWSHDVGLGARSRQKIEADLLSTNEAIRAAVPDARIGYYRQPGGNWTSGVAQVAVELGMTPLHWTVDPRDWTMPGASSIVNTVTGSTSAGAIVLMHDAGGDRRDTMAALYAILPNLLQRFYLEALPTQARVVAE
ncbi:polysaccharide deacetylase family protein [Micromonospora sp. NPDC003197]